MAWLSSLLQVIIPAFTVLSMLSVGLGTAAEDILESLRDARLNLRAIVANFVLVPALGFVLVQLLELAPGVEAGFALVASAAGAAFVIPLGRAAGADRATTAGMLVVMLFGTLLYMPVVVPLIIPAEVDVRRIGLALFTTMILPLLIGQFARALDQHRARRLSRPIRKASLVMLVLLVALTVVVNIDDILQLRPLSLVACFLFIVGAFLCGFFMGGDDPKTKGLMGLMAGQRNIAAAMVVASQGVRDPLAIVTVVATSLVGIGVLFPIARRLGRQEARPPPRRVTVLRPRRV